MRDQGAIYSEVPVSKSKSNLEKTNALSKSLNLKILQHLRDLELVVDCYDERDDRDQ